VKTIFKILNLDQSTKVTGYSIFVDNQLSDYGTLNSNPNEKNPIERMKEQYDLIKQLIEKTNPNYICIEQVQFQNNFNTFQQLSQLQGVIFAKLFEREIPFTIIEPSAWKSFCSIRGRKRVEQKANTIQMVKEKFNLEVSEDEADAIGIGLWSSKNIKILK
jgi:Holliday junction resolvasome RuvABC endonuclease subunit